MSMEGNRQATSQIQSDQGSAAQKPSGDPTQALQTLGHPFQSLAVEDDNLESNQTFGQLRSGLIRIQGAQTIRAFSQKSHAERNRYPSQFAIHGPHGCCQFLDLLGTRETPPTTARKLQERVSNQVNYQGKRNNLLITT